MSKVRFLSITNEHEIPNLPAGQDPMGGSWKPQGILFLKLTYTVGPDGLQFVYHGDSGFFKALVDLKSFCKLVPGGKQGKPTSPISPIMPTAKSLGFRIEQPCYVVFALQGSGNWEFRYDVDAVSCDVDPDKSVEYFDLVHVLNNGGTTPGTGIDEPTTPVAAPAENDKCRIVYFSAVAPSTKGGATPAGLDRFNLFVRLTQTETGQAQPTTLDLIIDPDIQNTGHPPGITGV